MALPAMLLFALPSGSEIVASAVGLGVVLLLGGWLKSADRKRELRHASEVAEALSWEPPEVEAPEGPWVTRCLEALRADDQVLLEGPLGQHEASVRLYTDRRRVGDNKSRCYYGTELIVHLKGIDPGFQMHVSKDGLGAKLVKAFGGQDMELGDPEFDRACRVRTNAPEQCEAMLTPRARAALMALVYWDTVAIKGGQIRFNQMRRRRYTSKQVADWAAFLHAVADGAAQAQPVQVATNPSTQTAEAPL